MGFSKIIIGAMIGYFSLGGCVYHKDKSIDDYLLSEKQKEGIYATLQPRVGLDMAILDIGLNKKIQTVPFDFENPDLGNSHTSLDLGFDLALRGGFEAAIGTENVRAKSGLDLRLNFTSLGESGYRATLNYDVTREPIPGESYSFTQLTPYYITPIPFLGFEYKFREGLKLDIEGGAAYSGFRLRTGRDTYGEWRTYRAQTWHGFGACIKVGFILSDEFFVGINYEHYEPEFFGESSQIDAYALSMDYRGEFR